VSQGDYSAVALGPERPPSAPPEDIQADITLESGKKRNGLIVTAVLLVAVIGTTALWLTTQWSLSETQS
jgi:hypothetical protein